uniref:COMM domain-containing protein n=1 Tax=Macrostomum lignano TaxID=282301 RepID=A0A1I8HYE1_9PLAT
RIFSGTNEQLHFIISLLQSGNTETLRVLFCWKSSICLPARASRCSTLARRGPVSRCARLPAGRHFAVSVGELLENIAIQCDWTLDEYVAVALSLLHLSERAPTGVGAAEKNDFKRRVGVGGSSELSMN